MQPQLTQWIIGIFLLALCASCGPTAPSEEEIRSLLPGKYCSDGHQLELSDSTFRNTKFHTGFTGSVFMENCRGTYELVYEEQQWLIRFTEAKQVGRTSLVDCNKERVIWTPEDAGEELKLTLEDLFDKVELSKAACD